VSLNVCNPARFRDSAHSCSSSFHSSCACSLAGCRHGVVTAATATQRRIVIKTVIPASLALAITCGTSFAGTPLINARQNAQAHRIYNGIYSGRISFPESQKLAQGQAHVQNLENQAKADGFVTPLERARIHAAQNIQSARIFLKKHN